MLSSRSRYARWNSGYAYWPARAVCRIVTSVLFDLKIHGAENVPEFGGALIVTNHNSYLDPPLVGVQILRPMNFMAKSELWRNRFFGKLITSVNAFPIRQGEGDVSAVRETITRLQEGALLNIFPEGSRSDDGELQKVQSGVALIIRRAGVPVIPCVIEGSFQAWPNSRKVPRRYPIDVMYGPRLDVEGLKSDAVVKVIATAFARMQAELRQRRAAQPRDGRRLPGL